MQRQNSAQKESPWKLIEPLITDYDILFGGMKPAKNGTSPSKTPSSKRRMSQISETRKLPAADDVNSSLSEPEIDNASNAEGT
jgi:hypothetical protein